MVAVHRFGIDAERYGDAPDRPHAERPPEIARAIRAEVRRSRVLPGADEPLFPDIRLLAQASPTTMSSKSRSVCASTDSMT